MGADIKIRGLAGNMGARCPKICRAFVEAEKGKYKPLRATKKHSTTNMPGVTPVDG